MAPFQQHRSRLRSLFFALALVLLPCGCADMFDPSGGAYARNRYTEPNAYSFTYTPTPTGVVLSATPISLKSALRLTSVYFYNRERVGAAAKNGPTTKFTLDAASNYRIALSWAEVARYDEVRLMGVFLEPGKMIDGARSVEANGRFDLAEIRSKAPASGQPAGVPSTF